MPYTKSQLLTKYDIPLEAFEVLRGLGHFKSAFAPQNGLNVVSPSKEDSFALECARLSLSGFRGAPLLPYHRFLILRFLCLPVEDVYEELLNLGLLESRERFDLGFLKKIQKAMIKRAPKEIAEVFKKHTPPKSKAAKARFSKFLDIVNVKFFYEHPERMEELDFLLKDRAVAELILTTTGSNDEIADFFSENMNAQVPRDGILAYRMLYYATHEMSDEAWKVYLSTVPPDVRKAKSDARGKDLIGYSIAKGIKGLASIQEVLSRTKTRYIRELGNSQGFKTPAALAAQRSALDSILKIDQYERNLGGDDADFWKIFERFSVREVDDQQPRTIHDIRQEQTGKEATGE